MGAAEHACDIKHPRAMSRGGTLYEVRGVRATLPRTVVRLEREFQAPVERVFHAWKEPRELERWAWGSLGSDLRATVDFSVGGRFAVSSSRPDGGRWTFT